MAEHTDNWGAMTDVLRELEPAGKLVSDKPITVEGARAYLRWMFAALETFTHCLKRITVDHVEREGTELTRREREVLSMIKEPSFPGLPPPRRVEIGMRESFGATLNVYARARRKESPLHDGRLPQVFIEASVLHDRLAHPESPSDLQLTKADFTTVVEFLQWFETIRNWLYKDRAAEIEEMKAKMNESLDALRRKLMGTGDDPSSG